MQTSDLSAVNFLLPVFVLVFAWISMRFNFEKEYDKDVCKYNSACNNLYVALRSADPFTPDSFDYLAEYLLRRLSLKGVSSWSSWGRSVRLFHILRKIVIGYAVCLFVVLALYAVIPPFVRHSSAVDTPGADEWLSGLFVVELLCEVLPLIMWGLVFCWAFSISRCRKVLAKRQSEEVFAPSEEWIRCNKVSPDYSLVLLSKLVSENRQQEGTRIPRN